MVSEFLVFGLFDLRGTNSRELLDAGDHTKVRFGSEDEYRRLY
jgi:hypothetical protein